MAVYIIVTTIRIRAHRAHPFYSVGLSPRAVVKSDNLAPVRGVTFPDAPTSFGARFGAVAATSRHNRLMTQTRPQADRFISGLPPVLARSIEWLRRALNLPARAAVTSSDTVVGSAELKRIVLRERARSDRTGSSLSLILLDSAGERGLEDQLDAWTLAISKRVRCTDSVGWYDTRTVGIVLTDTDHEGALIVVRQLRTHLPADASRARWRIFVHPEHTAASEPRRKSGEGESEDPLDLLRSPSRLVSTEPLHPSASSRRSAPSTRLTESSAVQLAAATLVLARPHAARRGEAGVVSRMESRPTPETTSRGSTGVEFGALQSLLLARTSPLKRCVDILGASLALALLSPVMLTAALAVKLTSPGPILFRQQRAGLGGRAFAFYKFRSMCVDAEQRKQELLGRNEQTGPVFKIASDPRITRVGRFLRRTSIDELPQLWNVLKGDMSLVGPRPPILSEVKDYERWQRRRLEIKGGLTCIWQVSGRSSILFNDWVRLDLRYVEQASALTDASLLARTLPAVLTCRGAH